MERTRDTRHKPVTTDEHCFRMTPEEIQAWLDEGQRLQVSLADIVGRKGGQAVEAAEVGIGA